MFNDWKLGTLNDIKAIDFFQLIEKNRDYIRPGFPITVSDCATFESTKAFINTSKNLQKEKKGHYFFVKHGATGNLIGYFNIKNMVEKTAKCEFAYFIDKDFQGKGIISKIVAQMITFCFDDLKMNKISICTSRNNISSQKIAQKNGFVQEGILRQEFKNHKGELEDIVYYGLLKSDDERTIL